MVGAHLSVDLCALRLLLPQPLLVVGLVLLQGISVLVKVLLKPGGDGMRGARADFCSVRLCDCAWEKKYLRPVIGIYGRLIMVLGMRVVTSRESLERAPQAVS